MPHTRCPAASAGRWDWPLVRRTGNQIFGTIAAAVVWPALAGVGVAVGRNLGYVGTSPYPTVKLVRPDETPASRKRNAMSTVLVTGAGRGIVRHHREFLRPVTA